MSSGQLVQELGYDNDVDFDFREAVEDITGEELADDDVLDAFDAVILWWRDGDGDLVDTLVDSQTSLDTGGTIWLLTPKAGRAGHVPPADVTEAAPTAGLHVTRTVAAADDWTGTRLVARKKNG